MTWDDLKLLRAKGMRPSLPVMITTRRDRLSQTLTNGGFAVLTVNAGEAFHVELLHDLDVLLFLGTCDRASSVIRAMTAMSVRPSRVRAWCECARQLQSLPVRCEVAASWQ